MMRRRLPEGLSFAGDEHPAASVAFLADLTWVDSEGSRHSSQPKCRTSARTTV